MWKKQHRLLQPDQRRCLLHFPLAKLWSSLSRMPKSLLQLLQLPVWPFQSTAQALSASTGSTSWYLLCLQRPQRGQRRPLFRFPFVTLMVRSSMPSLSPLEVPYLQDQWELAVARAI